MDLESPQVKRTEEQEFFISLRDILTVVFKHRLTIIVLFLMTTFCSLIFPLFMTPIYKAETSLLVKIGREHMILSEVGDVGPQMSVDLKTLVDPELAILASQDLRQRVIETLGINTIYPKLLDNPPETISPLYAALHQFEKNLDAHQEGESNVIKVSLMHQDPKIAAKAVNLLAEFWKEQHLKIFSTPQAPFLEEQAETYRERLEESETRIQQFKKTHGISSFLDEKRLLLEQRQQMDTKLKAVQNEIQGLMTKIASLTKQLKTLPEEIPLSMVSKKSLMIDDTKKELLDLRRKEQELSGRYQDKSRNLTEIRKEIKLIQMFIAEQEEQLRDTVTSGRNPVHQEIAMQLMSATSQNAALSTQERVLKNQTQDLDNQIRHLSQLEKEFDELEREVTKDQENLKRYLQKVEVARITQEMNKKQIANVSVIQAATAPMKPIKPKPALIATLGVILGSFSGLALAFILEALQSTYTRPEQIFTKLGLPILVSISNKEESILHLSR